MPESAYGPTNNCIGIGKVLERRGHRIVFAAEASWKGKLEPLGFEENLVDLAPPAEGEQDAGQFWTDFITETAPEFRKPTIEQLATFIEPVWSSLIDGARYCQPQLTAILDAGVHVLTISGPARAMLAGERTALNFVGRLSGIATLTSDYVRHTAGTKLRICCTRRRSDPW